MRNIYYKKKQSNRMLSVKEFLGKMCCCKACQYYLETIYWHCFEKHFCYDMNIALYEDEDTTKTMQSPKYEPQSTPTNHHQNDHSISYQSDQSSKNNSKNMMYDNMAFYDNVAIIAKRSIFIIDPQEEEEVDQQEQHQEEAKKNIEENKKIDRNPNADDDIDDDDISVVTEQPRFSINTLDSSCYQSETDVSITSIGDENMDDYKPKSEPNLVTATSDDSRQIPIICNTNATVSLSSLATISEENNLDSASKLDAKKLLPIPSKLRKKSLHERRVSRSLTLDIDKRQELPIIRQSSFPKFYIDTPDPGQQTASCLASRTIPVLDTPIQPKIFQYDLRKIVRIEDERRENQMLHKQVTRSASTKENKLIQFRDKLKPIKLLRNASMQSLHSNNHHY